MGFRLVVAAADTDLAGALAQAFERAGAEIAAAVCAGREALEKCLECKPQGLVSTAFLPEYNADDLAILTEQNCPFPLVKLAVGETPSRTVASRFLDCGGDLFFLLPLDYAYVLHRMEQFYSRKTADPEAENAAVYQKTAAILRRMNMLPSYKGFEYIPAAVEMIVRNPAYLEQTVRDLYPAIARRYGSTSAGVERCIRTALELTFERGDAAFIQAEFGRAISEKTGKIVNKEFLALLADRFREEG